MAVLSYSILFKKAKAGSVVKDLLSDFSMSCMDFAFPFSIEAKELASEDWIDEDGEDTFVPEILPIKAYDLEIKISYSGAKGTGKTKAMSLLNYLTGRDGTGSELSIYNPHISTGRQKVRFLSMTPEFRSDNLEDNFDLTIKLRVADPLTEITLSY